MTKAREDTMSQNIAGKSILQFDDMFAKLITLWDYDIVFMFRTKAYLELLVCDNISRFGFSLRIWASVYSKFD